MTEKFSPDKIKGEVINIIVSTLRIPKEKILPESRLFIDLDAESIDMLDIRYELERAFGVSISDGEIRESIANAFPGENIPEKMTVDSIMKFMEYKLSAE
jgi:acyl carrier protein